MLLAIEEHVEASLGRVVQSKLVWQLAEDRTLLHVERVNVKDLYIQPIILKSWIELQNDWLLKWRAHDLIFNEEITEVTYN